MGSLTIALIAGGWGIAALLVLRLFAAASRANADERFEPQQPEGVAAAGRERA
jgi:hypothetical protein